MKEKILLTGASGFIGTNLLEDLLAKGYEVKNLDWNKPKIHGQYGYKAVCIHCNNETATFANYKDAVGAWNMRLCTNTHQLNLFNYMENAHE